MLINFALAYLACVFLCIAMKRHSEQIFPRKKMSPTALRLLTTAGWLLMLVVVILCTTQLGISTGLVLFAGLLSAVVFMLALLLNYAARWIPAVGLVLVAVGLII
jgi:hypothetical protein